MIAMFDNIDAAEIPAHAQACAGYVGGRWPSWQPMVDRFPHLASLGRVVPIAVNTSEKARILDVETGDASAEQAGPWVKGMIAEGVHDPGVYCSRAAMPAVKASLAAAHLDRSEYVLWVADWTYHAHLPAGYEACQWTDKPAGAGSDDESLCSDEFFPPLPPVPHGAANAQLSYELATGKWRVAPAPGVVVFADKSLWCSAEVQFNEHTGAWRVASLPYDAKPLGG
jgi:hypothetical protein